VAEGSRPIIDVSYERIALIKGKLTSKNANKNINISEKLDLIKQNMELWDLFTGKEEYNPILLDRYERFPYYISNNRNIFEPVVSRSLIDSGLKIEYPGNKKFAVCLTHDIDAVQYPKISIINDTVRSLYHFQIKDALKRPFYKINKNWNPIWNFRDIMALEEKYQAKSSFYIMGLEKGDQDFNYEPGDLSQEMGYIIDEGWEVGLHGGHKAFNNLDVLKRERDRLEKVLGRKVIGYRNHFLRFSVPDTWELLKEAGFKYDATYGHPYCVGFRNGMCHPFKPFNLNKNKEIDILEFPLTIMDTTFGETYMRLENDIAWGVIQKLIDVVEKNQGVITILWHNTNMTGEKLKLYERILEYCKEKNAWMTSGEEIYNFWQ
jgi:peptidoglycan/xylan/chitin deacetylase (PgdA/CDA1 family)